MRPSPPHAARRIDTALLAIGHGGVDIYQGAVAALVPILVLERGYSLAAAAGIVLAGSLTSSIIQPVFGHLGDRQRLRWVVPVSIATTGAGLGTLALASDYWATLALVALSGIGIAAFHPAGARLARDLSARDPVLMSWFALGGNLGFAAAPFLIFLTVGAQGLRTSPMLIIPAAIGLAAVLVGLRRSVAVSAAPPSPDSGADPGHDPATPEDWRSFGLLSAAIMGRSVVFIGLSSFLVLYARQDLGLGPAGGTIALFLLYLGGAFGTVIGGRLARRWPRTRILRWSYALTVPALAGLLLAPGPVSYLFIVATSMGLSIPFSLHLTLAQDYLPRHIGTASGVTLGLAVSFGGLASPLIGTLAAHTGLRVALLPLIIIPALAWLLLRPLTDPRRVTADRHHRVRSRRD